MKRLRRATIGMRNHNYIYYQARVAEMVDALDLGSSSGDRVGVQISPLAPTINRVGNGHRVFHGNKGLRESIERAKTLFCETKII